MCGDSPDVVEDGGVSEQQLETLFGQRVTAFVMEETEDKDKVVERAQSGDA